MLAADSGSLVPGRATLKNMINNDVLRRIRFALDLSDHALVEMILQGQTLAASRPVPGTAAGSEANSTAPAAARVSKDPSGDAGVTAKQLQTWLLKENEDGFEECPDTMLNAFLDGLVRHLRGPSDRPLPAEPLKMTNNLVLKKLRIALSLRSDEVVADIKRGGGELTESELGAFFRAPDHRKYKECGDQMLRRFLQGAVLRLRPDKSRDKKRSEDLDNDPEDDTSAAADAKASPQGQSPYGQSPYGQYGGRPKSKNARATITKTPSTKTSSTKPAASPQGNPYGKRRKKTDSQE